MINHHHNETPILIVISGPSGVGKDAVLNRMKELGYGFHFTVTATTRHKREGVIDGKDYLFLTTDEFTEKLHKDEFLESARVYNNFYGVPKEQVRNSLASGKDVVIKIDVQGYELEVLKGAEKSLQQIDYMIAEVNRDEMYSGCPMIGDIDNYLKGFGFTRELVAWQSESWGDAFYIKV